MLGVFQMLEVLVFSKWQNTPLISILSCSSIAMLSGLAHTSPSRLYREDTPQPKLLWGAGSLSYPNLY